MIKEYCDCGKELEYIRTYSVIDEYDNKQLLETCWYCDDCNAEWTINIEVEKQGK